MADYIKKYEPIFGTWYEKGVIGEGSFGKVYRIERNDFGNTYKAALKLLTIPKNQDEIKSLMADGMDEKGVNEYLSQFVEDLVGEFVLMSKLKGNSHVVSYEDHQVIKHESGIGWDILIRMELLTSLIDYINSNKLTRKDVIKLGIDICKALELCQKYNIIHRDIKPENIFLSDSGDYKLGDFGIARQIEKTSSGLSKKGTYTYMAPEIYKGEAYGSTVDIYSLGVVMYRLLNQNRTPFLPAYPAQITHDGREQALMKRMSGVQIPPPCSADGRLAEIVLKALSYDSGDRYSSPMQMREELEAILYNQSEARIIYPKGDNVDIKSVNYIQTGDSVLYDFDKTQSMFSSAGADKTESMFANVKNTINIPKNKKKLMLVLGSALILAFTVTGTMWMTMPKTIPVTAISGVTDGITMTVGETYQLNPALEPNKATNKKIIYAADGDRATISETGLITAKTDGESKITIKADSIEKKIGLIIKPKPIISPTPEPTKGVISDSTKQQETATISSDASQTTKKQQVQPKSQIQQPVVEQSNPQTQTPVQESQQTTQQPKVEQPTTQQPTQKPKEFKPPEVYTDFSN